MIAAVDPSRSAPAGRASRIACGGAGSDGDAVCLPPDALHHQALGQQPAARHERGHENDPPADQREPPGVIESAPEPFFHADLHPAAAFPAAMVCCACNAVDGAMKRFLKLPAFFSYALAEIRELIRPRPHQGHVIDRQVALNVWRRVGPGCCILAGPTRATRPLRTNGSSGTRSLGSDL